MGKRIKIGTFNLKNLALPGVDYYPDRQWSEPQYARKIHWTAGMLQRMDADLVGFQEVFHTDALREAVAQSSAFEGSQVFAPGAPANGPVSGPRVGLVTRLRLFSAPRSIETFPEGVDLSFTDPDTGESMAVAIDRFSRPVLRADVELVSGVIAAVFVVHLKSKRPSLTEAEEGTDPRTNDLFAPALGSARSLIRRAAEAAALRRLIIDELEGTRMPVIVLGDLNDDLHAVTNTMIEGEDPLRFYGGLDAEQNLVARRRRWDVRLYNATAMHMRKSPRDTIYTHVYNGEYGTLDHIYLSEEFYQGAPRNQRLGDLEYVHCFNDHLVDQSMTFETRFNDASDHGQLVVTLDMFEPTPA
ncbi:MAG: endonuclease/exonuclease/phosphatase family protein [Geminicoccaceae bacterium]